MTSGIHLDPDRRHDFALVFDVMDGNPNGDPDAGNLPRVDPETMQGLVTDVAIKRKVRNYVAATRPQTAPWRIYVQTLGVALNTLHQEAYTARGLTSTGSKQRPQDVDQARAWMCEQFYDIRTFGAVMTTGRNCGAVQGPVQIGIARSVDPILALELAITRVAITKAEDTAYEVAEEGGEAEGKGKRTEMGRKAIVPYAVYVAEGQVSPLRARQTGFDAEDLALLWEALVNMWDLDRSAARGSMSCRGLYVFTHDSAIGNAPARGLLDRVRLARVNGETARRWTDYRANVADGLPAGVQLTTLNE